MFTSYITLAIAALVASITAAPAPSSGAQLTRRFAGEAHFVTNWDEGGRKRYRYNFKDTDCASLEDGIIHHGGIPGPAGMNFQCGDWGLADGFQTFDCSVVEGVAGVAIIADGIGDVTGQSCGASGFCP